MNFGVTFALLAGACLALSTQVSRAQASSDPVSRADVKAETRAAEKAGQLTPAGEGVPPMPQKQSKSSYTRAERKASTLQASKSGDLIPAGDAGQEKEIAVKEAKSRSTKTRAERKAETLAARKAGQLIPAGEGPTSTPR
jgi:hypothetical protein